MISLSIYSNRHSFAVEETAYMSCRYHQHIQIWSGIEARTPSTAKNNPAGCYCSMSDNSRFLQRSIDRCQAAHLCADQSSSDQPHCAILKIAIIR